MRTCLRNSPNWPAASPLPRRVAAPPGPIPPHRKPRAARMAAGALSGQAFAERLTVYSALDEDQVVELMDAFKAAHPEIETDMIVSTGGTIIARLIAEKIETAQQYDMVSSLGVRLFQGYLFSRPTLVEARLLSPSQASIVQLLNLVRSQAPTSEIEEALKKDAGLAFNLMRLINSAGLGLTREITSFRQAVLLLGLKKLFRWAALLLTVARSGGTPPAVGQTAVVRGRLMELLAREFMSPEQADQAFVIGVFSMLDQMLGMPLEPALGLLHLPDELAAALLRRDNAYGQLLTLAEACESSDDSRFDQAAQSLRLSSQQINLAHLQALAWADQMTQG